MIVEVIILRNPEEKLIFLAIQASRVSGLRVELGFRVEGLGIESFELRV